MKKIIVLAILACVITAFAFGESYTVQSVTGRVEREAGGQRVVVKAGNPECRNGYSYRHRRGSCFGTGGKDQHNTRGA